MPTEPTSPIIVPATTQSPVAHAAPAAEATVPVGLLTTILAALGLKPPPAPVATEATGTDTKAAPVAEEPKAPEPGAANPSLTAEQFAALQGQFGQVLVSLAGVTAPQTAGRVDHPNWPRTQTEAIAWARDGRGRGPKALALEKACAEGFVFEAAPPR